MVVLPRLLALVVSAASAVGVWATWRVFVATATGQAIEKAALAGAAYGQTRLWRLAEPLLDVVSFTALAAGAAVAVGIALARRRWALAVSALVLVGGANVTTQVLKAWVLDRPALGGDLAGGPSLPSGHTTAAASFAAALVLVVPRRARPWAAALGAVYTAATGVSTLIGQWHRPSDVVAAILVVLAWAALVCAVGTGSAVAEARGPAQDGAGRRAGTAPAVAVLLLGALLAGLPAAWGGVEAYRAVSAGGPAGDVATYAAGALAVASVSAVAFAVLLLVRHSIARPRDS